MSLFNESYYLARNPDVADAVQHGMMTAYEHFTNFGSREGRDPNALFDTSYYLEQNPDVAAAVQNGMMTAYEHFASFGMQEGRTSATWFDLSYYLQHNPDVHQAYMAGIIDPVEHFINYGIAEGRSPHEGITLSNLLTGELRTQVAAGHAAEVLDDIGSLVNHALSTQSDLTPEPDPEPEPDPIGDLPNFVDLTPGNDNYTGAESDDFITGNGGNDTINGGAGDDVIIAYSLITGVSGNDVLTGGTGADWLNGGSGQDEFRYAAGDSPVTAYDTTDFDGTDIFLFDTGSVQFKGTVAASVHMNIDEILADASLVTADGDIQVVLDSSSIEAYNNGEAIAPIGGAYVVYQLEGTTEVIYLMGAENQTFADANFGVF